MSNTTAWRGWFPSTAGWILTLVLLLTTGNPLVQACDDGRAVPNPKSNPGLVEDCKALLAARDKLDGAGSLNWNAGLPINDWEGIRATGTPARVTRIEIFGNRLRGRIPPELSRLSHLRYLDISDHQLTGGIPAELGQLSRLTSLLLNSNGLTGEIPVELGQMSQLGQLWIYENQLTGGIPAELGKLTRMNALNLSDNQLTGPIPAELGQLSRLHSMRLGENRLTGPIPGELGQLSRLLVLHLFSNRLTGRIPPELGQVTGMTWLELHDNRLTGPIPKELGRLNNLSSMDLSSNQLTGAIPPELGRMARLGGLNLSDNRLTGPLPGELSQLTRLGSLNLSHNQLSGPIPAEFGQLTNLAYLDLSDNRLTGPIPPELGRLTRMEWLHLHNNRLSGSIPPELGQLTGLWQLHLQHNRLTGPFPAELGRLTRLQEFSYLGNQLTGPVPARLRHLPDLYVLNLTANWIGPDRIKVTWDDPGDPTARYEYRLWSLTLRDWIAWATIPEAALTAGEGVTIECALTDLATDAIYTYIAVRAINRSGHGREARAPVESREILDDTDDDPNQELDGDYCRALWDGDPCATAAVLPHVFMGPLGEDVAEAEILITNRDPDPQDCDTALLFHRGTSEAPEILFDDEPIEGNLFRAAIPAEGARILTLTADSADLLAGAVSVFVRSPCAAGSLQVQGRYLVENPTDGEIREVFSVSGQSPEEWLGDGHCQVLTGVFGDERDLGFAYVTTDPQREAPEGSRLVFRSFDLEGNPTVTSFSSLEIAGEQTASFPWSFQEPTIIEMCLEVPGTNSGFQISTIAIGIVRKGDNVQWSDETVVDRYPSWKLSAWSEFLR